MTAIIGTLCRECRCRPCQRNNSGHLRTSCRACARRRQRSRRLLRGQPRKAYGSRYARKRKRWIVGRVCAFCGGEDELTVDHVVPLARGGSLMDKGNWRALCLPCHKALNRRTDIARVWLGRLAVRSGKQASRLFVIRPK